SEWHPELTRWRRDLHQHPQPAFEETFASEFIATRLTEMGIPVSRGWAKTGVVGSIVGKQPGSGETRAIGLRADIDALDITEATGLPYASVYPGKMHACGHDGHTTMLLGAAKYLAATRDFAGTVHVIFQPAEENEGGGRVMVEEGLFDQFPMDSVYGMHNWPGIPVGQFAACPGPIMAAFDVFEIIVTGRGSHAARPHDSIDPIIVASQLVTALQGIASRQTNPHDQVVVSVTQFHSGDTWNVIPCTAMLRGTVRTFRKAVQDATEQSMERIVHGLCAAYGAQGTLRYERRYPATINTPAEAAKSAATLKRLFGASNVNEAPEPSMGGEDFSFMLEKRPGCYIWAGNGPCDGDRLLHNPHYDFNDELLPVGAAYWVGLAEDLLPIR
ncbi:MAG: putative hydrolase, partial [Planctomycetaceae bacterium]|nr:putative hydrolase [Planctomycetaceae bacterium]